MYIVAYTEYSRDYEFIDIKVVDSLDALAEFLIEDLGLCNELEGHISLNELLDSINDIFVGDGTDLITSMSISDGHKILLQV